MKHSQWAQSTASVETTPIGSSGWLSLEHPASAQVVISQFMSSSPTVELAAISMEPALDPLSPRRPLCSSPACTLSLSKNKTFRGAWVAHSVKHPTLGFGSGHDLTVSWVRAPQWALC